MADSAQPGFTREVVISQLTRLYDSSSGS